MAYEVHDLSVSEKPLGPDVGLAKWKSRIDSVPNMRLLCNQFMNSNEMFSPPKAGLYRSSKPDHISQDDLTEFRNLGIKCIIDFRSKDEYFGSEGCCLLDKEYILHKVIPPKKVGQSTTFERIDLNEKAESEASSCFSSPLGSSMYSTEGVGTALKESDGIEKRHFLINFFTPKYIFRSFSRLPCYLYCIGIFHLLCDLIRRDTKFKNFSLFFTSNVLNRAGIKGQYRDVVDLCQPSVCASLKLIADPQNHPALINCAHGKDRTGIVSALVLTCLGMPKEYIAEEYALSEDGLEPIKDVIRKDIYEKYRLKEEFLSAEADTMRHLLCYIEDKYGSIEDYMETIGFSYAEQSTLRANFSAPGYEISYDAKAKDGGDTEVNVETTTPRLRSGKHESNLPVS
ncbi:hypothetical protein PoB_007083600 [Plakobranchus ocellatus]|uniref:Tyrosine specific protein phosphatases domain-containing protein n=1 Tax=Plakobranchus ocellatus TaxID=259542 RepID=A0AAV4DJH6_9GAST|nr:hypothetical protein PoB_007083600 [Plakobranchus ocellatus]